MTDRWLRDEDYDSLIESYKKKCGPEYAIMLLEDVRNNNFILVDRRGNPWRIAYKKLKDLVSNDLHQEDIRAVW